MKTYTTQEDIRFDEATAMMTKLQIRANNTILQHVKMMSSERYPIVVCDLKYDWNHYDDSFWMTITTKHDNAGEGNALAAMRERWFVRVTRRGRIEVHSGPGWAGEDHGYGVHKIHAVKTGYFG